MELSACPISESQSQSSEQSRIGRLGMWLFIASLSVLFIACVVGYVIIRLRMSQKIALGSLHLPSILWISTLTIMLSSLTIERAYRLLASNNVKSFKQQLLWTNLLTACFLFTQIPGLWLLLQTHHRVVEQSGVAMYGMVFMVILLHAMHVVGGVVPLVAINKRAWTTGYTSETALPVRILAMYWHFLDVVWLSLFGLLTLLG